jgi:GntR family transcriptional regulator
VPYDDAVLRRDVVPLYHQLKELLTEKIESGEWAPGRQLPGENELTQEYGVSRATVRQAMQLLENQGLVERFQGRGTFVGRPKIANNLMDLFSPIRGMMGANSLPRLDVEYLTVKLPPASVAARLGLGATDTVYELQRKVVVDNEPLLVLTSWLSTERFPELEVKFESEKTIIGVLHNHYGIERVRQHKEVEVTILDEEEACSLEARAGAPALLCTYLTSLPNGEPIEYRKLVVRGDRCRYYVDQESPEFFV